MKVSVIIPTLNEEKTISKVVRDFKKNRLVKEIIVYDGGSTDKTRYFAKNAKAKVLLQEGKGKGCAIREIFKKINSDIYVLVDGDDTYPANSLNDLIKPIIKNHADMVVGTRLNKNVEPGSIKILHRLGNWIISKMLSISFRKNLNDVLSGYRAISKKLAKEIRLNSKGFEVETELTIKSLIGDYKIVEIPIKYRKRQKNSKSKLSSFGDGYLIFYTIISMIRDYKPLFFFSILSLLLGIMGISLGYIVVDEWLRTGVITRLPTAILSALLVFMSVQFFTIGLVLDSINRILSGKGIISK